MIQTATEAQTPRAGSALEWKLWLYTNYDCNLCCSYCVAKSGPNVPRRALGLVNVQRLVRRYLFFRFTGLGRLPNRPFPNDNCC